MYPIHIPKDMYLQDISVCMQELQQKNKNFDQNGYLTGY